MSVKWLIFVAAAGAGLYAVSRAQPPVQAATAGKSTAVDSVSFYDKLKYSIGSVGCAVVGGTVRRSVEENERTLAELKNKIRTATGWDGDRARDVAKRIVYMDSVALENLHQGRPIKAVKLSMEAKSLLNAVRRNITRGV